MGGTIWVVKLWALFRICWVLLPVALFVFDFDVTLDWIRDGFLVLDFEAIY